MKAQEWRLVGEEEIAKSKADLKQELFDLRFKAATEALENPARIRHIKRDLARIATVLNERASGRSVQGEGTGSRGSAE